MTGSAGSTRTPHHSPARRRLTGNFITPHQRCTNPSVTAQSAATAPLSGEPRAWAVVCNDGASVYHDADISVSLPPVRGGVLDAPRSRDRRGGLDAAVRPDQPHPRRPRCVRLPPPPNVSNPAGTARAPFRACNRRRPSTEGGASGTPPLTGGLFTLRCGIHRKGTARAPFCAGEPKFSIDLGRAGVEARPYGVLVKFQRTAGVVRHPARGALCAYFIMRFITAILALVSGLYRRGGSPGKRRRMPSRCENSSKLQRP